MTKIVVYSDTHVGSVAHAELRSITPILAEVNENPLTFATGDIVDRTNCKKSKVTWCSDQIFELKRMMGPKYVFGNHEAIDIRPGFHVQEINNKRVIFFHGPGIYIDGSYWKVYYSESKTDKWANKKKGRSFWSALGYKVYRSFAKHKGSYKKPSDDILERIVDICEVLKCDVAIFGHTHRSWDDYHHRVRIINVPKGRTEIEI
jgi:predicted phosphodiesterase